MTERQSPRFHVISRSNTVSPFGSASTSGVPLASEASSSMIPEWSCEMQSSFAEQSMPDDGTPRSLAGLILKPPSGTTAPIFATATLRPARQLGAPQTMPSFSPPPTSTVQTCMWSESGWGSQVRTSPTTKCSSRAGPSVSTASTSTPEKVSLSDSSCVDMSETSTYSFSQETGIFMVRRCCVFVMPLPGVAMERYMILPCLTAVAFAAICRDAWVQPKTHDLPYGRNTKAGRVERPSSTDCGHDLAAFR